MTLTINAHTVLVAICWTAGFAFAIADIFFEPVWSAMSTGCVVLGATLIIRRRVDRVGANWTTAYELGRDEAEVRKIR